MIKFDLDDVDLQADLKYILEIRKLVDYTEAELQAIYNGHKKIPKLDRDDFTTSI